MRDITVGEAPSLTLIAGGIGCGKSVVSAILRAKGFEVYDSDSKAKEIMDSDNGLQRRLCEDIHALAVKDGIVDRKLISEIVFNDAAALARLNSIVHAAVIRDLSEWQAAHGGAGRLFVECAIPRSSGLVDLVDAVWEVVAPEEVRIARVEKRNGLSREHVLARMAAQESEDLSSYAVEQIVNDNVAPILPQINHLLLSKH